MKILIETIRLTAILLILSMGIIGVTLAFLPEPQPVAERVTNGRL